MMIPVWKRILERNPDCVLYLKCEKKRDRFYYESLPKNQYKFLLNKQDRTTYLDVWNMIDVCIDTYSYSGTTTTCSSLSMGVPVFTIKGDRHVSNVSTSLMLHTNQDLSSYVASNFDEYVGKIQGRIEAIRKEKSNMAEYTKSQNEYREKVRHEFFIMMSPKDFMRRFEKVLIDIHEETK